jgi:hypothetical protein
MRRNVTALYRSHATVDLLCEELRAVGVDRTDIKVVPTPTEGLGQAGLGSDPQPIPALHDLELPQDDVRAYEDRVRGGDVLVSVQVDEAMVGSVEEIMRSPENFAHLHDHDRDGNGSARRALSRGRRRALRVPRARRARRVRGEPSPGGTSGLDRT